MEEKIIKILKEHGLTKSDLTKEELEELEDEIRKEENGVITLDGVFSNPEIFYRKFRNRKQNCITINTSNKMNSKEIKKIVLTKEELEALKQVLQDEQNGIFVTYSPEHIVSRVIEKATSLLDELEAYDDANNNMLEWYYNLYLSQQR